MSEKTFCKRARRIARKTRQSRIALILIVDNSIRLQDTINTARARAERY